MGLTDSRKTEEEILLYNVIINLKKITKDIQISDRDKYFLEKTNKILYKILIKKYQR